MTNYSFSVVATSDVRAIDFGGQTEDMSNFFNWHNVQSVTFSNPQQVTVTDDDDRFRDDDRSPESLVAPFDGLPAGTKFEPEYYIDLLDVDGNTYRLVAISTDGNFKTAGAYAFVGDPPPYGTCLTVDSVTLTDRPDDLYTALAGAGDGAVCFAAGSLIETPFGPERVEALKVGDLVTTRDHGDCQIQAILRRDLDFSVAPARLKPVRFGKGSLGDGLPLSALTVSPHHRMLVADGDGGCVLVPAKALCSRPGIRILRGKRTVTYIHIVFSRHEIVYAHGVLSESFYPGPMALRMVSPAMRRELSDIFGPEPFVAPASELVTMKQARSQASQFRAIGAVGDDLPLSGPLV